MFWRKKEIPFNVHHPRFSGETEKLVRPDGTDFKVDGIQYYRFKEDAKMPYGRYKVIQSFLLSYELRMDYDLFKAFLKEVRANIDGSRGKIQLDGVFKTLDKMEARAELAFDPDQGYNLASVVYFDASENLFSYDGKHNKDKVARWKEANELDFFYTRPMAELIGWNNFSKQDLTSYINQVRELISDLTLDTQQV